MKEGDCDRQAREGGLSQAASSTIPQCRANPPLSLSSTQAAKFPRTYHLEKGERVHLQNHIPANLRHSSLVFSIPECSPLLLTICHGTPFSSSSFCKASCLAGGVVIGHLLLVGNLRSQGGQTPAKQASRRRVGGVQGRSEQRPRGDHFLHRLAHTDCPKYSAFRKLLHVHTYRGVQRNIQMHTQRNTEKYYTRVGYVHSVRGHFRDRWSEYFCKMACS